jgi:hypothetical protein
VALCVLSLTLTLLLYGRTLTFGFDWDDYHFLRPYTMAEVARAWTGPWDARDGIEVPFYRPVTIALYAARVWLLGPRSLALHALSVALFAMAAVLTMVWLRRLEVSQTALAAGTLAFVTHPVMPASAVVWITSQMHLLELLLVLTALIVATRDPRQWRWLIALQLVTVLVKEDAVMLAPAIAAVWIIRGIRVPRAWIVASAAVIVSYLAVRTWALAGWGGYSGTLPVVYIVYAPLTAVRVAGRVHVADWFAAGGLLALGALAAWYRPRASRPDRQPFILGLILLVLFSTPLILSRSAPVRSHLLGLCVALGVAGAVQILGQTRQHTTSLALVSLIVSAFVVSNWAATNRFSPCAAGVLERDDAVRSWGERVPPALRNDLAAKRCP